MALHALAGYTILPAPPCAHQLGSFLNPIIKGFRSCCEGTIAWTLLLNKWLAGDNSISSTSSTPPSPAPSSTGAKILSF